ncbi:cortex morphogenetic protein CmpA [Laceyella sacchari]|uniref:Cortex morphogenetic protein CmpA n=2 Tax=Laceyella TaxID=292635 RepID=A0AA45WSC3_9BACL|nr:MULTISPECIES: cortex morphogenetic protein CmpA [Laceyella]AUS07695.1 cortex morphogenetic protein CmpA [Laceyella sacchari]MRG27499.1 cortex morphogenetic protein CmpA [Laceyella tengchongensis]PRZ11973.1 hypothetical protein CLV36_11850 [Laceyella sediminis]SMP34942.1 hypothetical protein SAMN06265361_11249 [Laceyella tengchongensis]
MPSWLIKQLMHAFSMKDRRLIQWLNHCWFHYRCNQGKRIS